MTPPAIAIAPIVEGHGEVSAVPILLRRVCVELYNGLTPLVLTPIRQPRDRLLSNRNDCLKRTLNLAVRKLRQASDPPTAQFVLVIVDADRDCAATIGPRTQKLAETLRADADVSVVLAVWEYETWFTAAADSLSQYLDLRGESAPEDPEEAKCRKSWIEQRWRGVKYSESVDQPKLTAAMDLCRCRDRSPSFGKLCREIEKRFPRQEADAE